MDVFWQDVLAYLFGLVLIYLFLWLLYYPLKWTTKIVINALLGILLLLVVKTIGRFFGYSLPINPLTALIAGFLGVPGVVLLILLKYFLF